ncbi:MAG: hypothetical protein JWP27_1255 [Flaviaesturariibacter sp.]|nr:hypothetical protein [Flaviaesturariibacter sp.]
MLYNQSDLDTEIRDLHARILQRRQAFDAGIKSDTPFGELKEVFAEIKSLEKTLDLCFEESNAQKG